MDRSNRVKVKAKVDAETLALIDADARENGSRVAVVAGTRLTAHLLDTGKVTPFVGNDLAARRLSIECEALQDKFDHAKKELIKTENAAMLFEEEHQPMMREFADDILAGIAPLITPAQLAEAREHLDHSVKNLHANRTVLEHMAKEESARWRTRR